MSYRTGFITVYGLYDSRDPEQRIRYVGETGLPAETRLETHRYNASRTTRQMPVYSWMRETGVDNVAVVELERCDRADRFKREAHWITVKETLTIQCGFNEYLGRRVSEAARAKLRQYKTTPEQSSKLSASMKASPAFQAANARLNEAQRGKANRGTHTRWHEARGVVSSQCQYCGE